MGKKICKHDTMLFRKNNEGTECLDCGETWVRVRYPENFSVLRRNIPAPQPAKFRSTETQVDPPVFPNPCRCGKVTLGSKSEMMFNGLLHSIDGCQVRIT